MKNIDLDKALNIWHDNQSITQGHLSLERMYAMSQDGGLKLASQEDIEHLTICPECLDQWELLCWLKDDDKNEDQNVIGQGFLKAAASDGFEPLVLTSQCKKFILCVYYDSDKSGNGVVTLDIEPPKVNLENLKVRVIDKDKKTILFSVVHNKKAAQKVTDLNQYDFSEWTIVTPDDQEDKDG